MQHLKPLRLLKDSQGASPAPAPRRRAKPSQGAMSPAPAEPSPPPPGASVPRAGAAARASRQPVHTRPQPLAGGLQPPAPRRLTPRRPRNSRAAPQAHPDARRTFHEPRGPPEVDAERACQDRVSQTPGVAPAQRRRAKPSQGASSPAPAAPSPPLPGASIQRAGAAARKPREAVHTRQPLAGGRLHPSAPRPEGRLTPRRPRNSRAAPQARLDARRT